MPTLSTREEEFGRALMAVIERDEFEAVTTGETFTVMSTLVASVLASDANYLADLAPAGERQTMFRKALAENFGAFSLMLANDVFIASGNGPLDVADAEGVTVLDWLRRQMEDSNGRS